MPGAAGRCRRAAACGSRPARPRAGRAGRRRCRRGRPAARRVWRRPSGWRRCLYAGRRWRRRNAGAGGRRRRCLRAARVRRAVRWTGSARTRGGPGRAPRASHPPGVWRRRRPWSSDTASARRERRPLRSVRARACPASVNAAAATRPPTRCRAAGRGVRRPAGASRPNAAHSVCPGWCAPRTNPPTAGRELNRASAKQFEFPCKYPDTNTLELIE
jgi:hypothetical protein